MKKRILVVDDDPGIADIISKLLRHGLGGDTEYEVMSVNLGLKATHLLRTERFDLALLDIMMPGMDGVETLGWLKIMQPDLPVIILTAVSDESIQQQALERGARQVITKPFDADELLEVIRSTLRQSSSDANRTLPPE